MTWPVFVTFVVLFILWWLIPRSIDDKDTPA